MSAALIAGVGMTAFSKPSAGETYPDMGERAIRATLGDAGLEYSDIQQAYAGFVYGDSTAGQKVLYRVGMTGIPVINVNNNCSTGSTALFLARQAVESGAVDCALAVGFEQMVPGALGAVFTDRPSPFEDFAKVADEVMGPSNAPLVGKFFGGAGREYQDEYGAEDETFALISVKARAHAANNPCAVFRQPVSLEEVMASPHIYGPLTRLQCCPPTCGAAAAIICSEGFAARHGLNAPVRIRAQSMTTDRPETFDANSMIKMTGYDLSKEAADRVYAQAGVGPEDVDVVELHDCFTANELLTYEALGLTEPGSAERFIRDGDNSYGGKVVTNPSGGLLSKGHPLGATGLAQCYELVNQLRDTAGAGQVAGARLALGHNLGLGGACVVTLYEGPSTNYHEASHAR